LSNENLQPLGNILGQTFKINAVSSTFGHFSGSNVNN